MERKTLTGVLLVAAVGVLLLDKGITGLAILNPADASLGSASPHFNFLLGAVLLIVAVYSSAWLTAVHEPQ